jgi:hypothetical protein
MAASHPCWPPLTPPGPCCRLAGACARHLQPRQHEHHQPRAAPQALQRRAQPVGAHHQPSGADWGLTSLWANLGPYTSPPPLTWSHRCAASCGASTPSHPFMQAQHMRATRRGGGHHLALPISHHLREQRGGSCSTGNHQPAALPYASANPPAGGVAAKYSKYTRVPKGRPAAWMPPGS